MLSSLKYILPKKLYVHLFTAVQQMINNMPNLIHPTLTPSTIFKGTKIDLNFQKIVPFSSYATLHFAKRVDKKFQSHTNNDLLLYLTDDTTSNMTAWIPGRNNVAIINKYTIINAQVTSDFKIIEISSPPTYRTSSTYVLVLKRVPKSIQT